MMICYNNLQSDLCCLNHGAVEWFGPDGPWGSGAIAYRYLSICCNIPVILLEEYNVYNYDL